MPFGSPGSYLPGTSRWGACNGIGTPSVQGFPGSVRRCWRWGRSPRARLGTRSTFTTLGDRCETSRRRTPQLARQEAAHLPQARGPRGRRGGSCRRRAPRATCSSSSSRAATERGSIIPTSNKSFSEMARCSGTTCWPADPQPAATQLRGGRCPGAQDRNSRLPQKSSQTCGGNVN